MIVDELKKSILDSAFKGLLSSKNSNDTEVLSSLVKIEKQKQDLIKKYNVRKEPEYKEVLTEEQLFFIPPHWKWLRLGELGVFKKGPFGSALTKSIFIPDSIDAIKVYEQKNAIQKDITLGDYYITKEYYEKNMLSFKVETGDILVSCAGTIGETYVVPVDHREGIINQALMKMTMVNELNVEYFLLYFDYILKKMSNNLSSGSAIKNIPPFEIFKQLVIPIPPIEEQQRIVVKVEELFVKLDEVKILEEELNTIKNNFSGEMINSILLYAFQGKLTARSKNDTEIQETLKTIAKEKNLSLTSAKKSVIETIKEDEIPFEIPNTWAWVRWGELSNSIQYGVNAGASKSGNVKLVRISDIQNNEINWNDVPYSNIKENEVQQFLLNENDILFARTGGTVGKSVVVKNIPNDVPYVFAGYLIRSNYSNKVNYRYLKYFMESPLYWQQLKSGTIGSAQPNCNGQTLSKMILPLPPIEEQQRIVDKLDQLLLLCNDIDNIVNGK